jgi:hypothetical protein
MLGSKNKLTSSGDMRQDRAQALSSPGMADWVDLDGNKHCASCRYFFKKQCGLYAAIMRQTHKGKVRSPELSPGQRACRKYEPRDGAASSSRQER